MSCISRGKFLFGLAAWLLENLGRHKQLADAVNPHSHIGVSHAVSFLNPMATQ